MPGETEQRWQDRLVERCTLVPVAKALGKITDIGLQAKGRVSVARDSFMAFVDQGTSEQAGKGSRYGGDEL